MWRWSRRFDFHSRGKAAAYFIVLFRLHACLSSFLACISDVSAAAVRVTNAFSDPVQYDVDVIIHLMQHLTVRLKMTQN